MIILTGGAGFIGSAFLWKLNREGLTDIILVDKLRKTDKWRNLNNKVFEDYIDKEKFLDFLEKGMFADIDAVFHIGACSSTTERDADYMMQNNYAYTKRLALWCLKNNVKFIYASSAATYGDGALGYSDEDENTWKLKPLNVYGYSKHLFDLWVLKHKLQAKFTGFKYFNVYGPNEYHKGDMMSVICKAHTQIKEQGFLRLFKSYKPGYNDGEQKRDFVYVKDIVNVMFYFYQHKDKAGIFNLGTGQARTFNDLAKATFIGMGLKPKIRYIPMPLHLRDRYQYFTQADLAKLRSVGYTEPFTSLEVAVQDYVKNYLSQEESCL